MSLTVVLVGQRQTSGNSQANDPVPHLANIHIAPLPGQLDTAVDIVQTFLGVRSTPETLASGLGKPERSATSISEVGPIIPELLRYFLNYLDSTSAVRDDGRPWPFPPRALGIHAPARRRLASLRAPGSQCP